MENQPDLVSIYQDFYIKEGRLPHHEADLASFSGITENDLYKTYSSLRSLENQLFRHWAEQTLAACAADPSFDAYGAREKMLALSYTLLETLKPNRSLIKAISSRTPSLLNNKAVKGMESPLGDFFQVLIVGGTSSGEIVARPLLGPQYKLILWWTILLILQFWLKDESSFFEQTDVAVEKSVHFAMDLMAPNALDSAVEWMSFYLKNLL